MRRLLVYGQITVGALIGALALTLFMVPSHLPSGGLGGLLLIFHYLWGIPVGPFYFLANVPALIWLYKLYGWRGLTKSVYGIAAFSVFLSVTEPLAVYAPTHNPLLAAIFGGALLGLCVALTLSVGGDTGGNSSYVRIVHHYTGVNVPRALMVTDFVILCFGAITISVESILYSLIFTVVCGYVTQMVQEGFTSSRCFLIISERPDEVGAILMSEVRRGVTRLNGQGEYTGQARPVLMCAVSAGEAFRVKQLIMNADPQAFVLNLDAREVAGHGFTIHHELRPLPYWVTGAGD
ncbi:MAG TPA: YitT family protein [Symbiobacteriaceae bacterium]|nr:YitT family protein [Symbiobacteriaceae bacterium]